MQEHIINIIGAMLTLAAPGSTPQKPHFSLQVTVNSIFGLTGQDDLESRQKYLWEEVCSAADGSVCRGC